MHRILDNELSDYTKNYLEEHNISKDDLKIIKNYINESKRLVNNLKVYYLETKRVNKYQVSSNNNKIRQYNEYKDRTINELDTEIKVLLEMKEYLRLRNTTNNLSQCSEAYTRNSYKVITLDILNRESLLIKDYIDNTNKFLTKRPLELNDVSYQSYINDVLDIVEENLKAQEETYYNNCPVLTKNREYVRNIYNASYNNLINSIYNSSTDPDKVKIGLSTDVKSIKKQHKENVSDLVDIYIDETFKHIDNISEAKICNFTLFK